MFSAYTSYSPEHLDMMQRFESYIREMLKDENALMAFIEKHREEIEWD